MSDASIQWLRSRFPAFHRLLLLLKALQNGLKLDESFRTKEYQSLQYINGNRTSSSLKLSIDVLFDCSYRCISCFLPFAVCITTTSIYRQLKLFEVCCNPFVIGNSCLRACKLQNVIDHLTQVSVFPAQT